MHSKIDKTKLEREKITKLVEKADDLSLRYCFGKRWILFGHSVELMPEKIKLQKFLDNHSDIECLQMVSEARIDFDECIENDYERAVSTDDYYRADPCIDHLSHLFRTRKVCIATHSIEDDKVSESESIKLG